MADPNLLQAFSQLEQRLYNIRKDASLNLKTDYTFTQNVENIKRFIFSTDLESAQDYLNMHIDNIRKLIEDLPKILKKLKFENDNRNIFQNGITISGKQLKKEFREKLFAELSYYLLELENLSAHVIEKFSELGDDKFANAGFKLKLNLNVVQIGNLFNALYETNVIDKSSIKKHDLAKFISLNFCAGTTDTISYKSIKNYLNRNDQAELIVSEKLNAIIDFLDTEHASRSKSTRRNKL